MVLAYIQLALSMAFVGINISIGKKIVEHVPVFLFSEIRFVLAALILLPLLAMRNEWKTSWGWQEGKTLFWQAFFGVFLFSICMLYGVQWTSATSAGIITSTVPACFALLSYFLLRERIRSHQWLSILLSVAGIGLITFAGGMGQIEAGAMFGNFLVFLAVISEALFTIFAKQLSGRITPFQMTAAINVISLFLFFPFAISDFMKTDLSAVPLQVWVLMIYYALTASVFSFLLWYLGVAKVTASTAGLFTGFMPLSAALVSVLFLGEDFTWAHAVGMLFVLGAIVAGTRGTAEQPRANDTEQSSA